jgi:hypothetical protein
MPSNTKYIRLLKAMGERYFDRVEIEQGGKHLAVRCFRNGQERRITVSVSPSDPYRALANIEGDMKRTARGM